MRRNRTIFARKALYHLKKRYGAPADLYHIIAVTDDPETGLSVITKLRYHINKVILLDTTLTREMNLAGAYRRTDQGFPSNEIDVDTQLLIIDKEDLPSGLEVNDNDYLIIKKSINRKETDGKRYNIQRMKELEDDISVLVIAKYIKGGKRNETFNSDILENLIINEVNDIFNFKLNISETLTYTETVLALPPAPVGGDNDNLTGILGTPGWFDLGTP